ncbi:pyrophosphate-fructose-6-phosphate-phosphotransferase alpha1 [Artemisia annua]|uniref:Pyrophosphate-fructose-6-phosphate-phosphotransferase alpha1 n=1 Tax=Artemisia annua TaxID=35608 RepID=A0A2U1NNB0_ARTAN|nr:pyrophosphate-fructose-6-phosphate-phosphotransferase alpha1 [Artemisia annua]
MYKDKLENTAFGSKLVATAEYDKLVTKYGLLVKKRMEIEIQLVQKSGFVARIHHRIEVIAEFKPVEHPTDPFDMDQPIHCPLPETSILNRQSPGGHNVVWGLHEALKIHNSKSTLLGFFGGSEGLFAQRTLEMTNDVLATYKNQGDLQVKTLS